MTPCLTMQKYETTVQALQSPNVQDRYHAVRSIKNSIIGNKTKKLLFMKLGIVPKMVEILSNPQSDTQLKIQVAVVLGSFAYGNEQNIESLVQAGAIIPLLESLSAREEKKLQESAARALKAILQNPSVPRDDIFRPQYGQALVQLLANVQSHANIPLAELAASILARCCETAEQQAFFCQLEALPWLLQMLVTSHPKAQESALDALGSLCFENAEVSKVVVQMSLQAAVNAGISASATNASGSLKLVPTVVRHLHDSRPSMRLIAATALANLYRSGAIPEHHSDITTHVLPALVKLFRDATPAIQEKAPAVFARLVSDNEEMQKAAADADAITKLAAILTATNAETPAMASGHAERLKEAALVAIAAVCSTKEECRKQVIDAKILPAVIQALEDKHVGIRTAACRCTRSLSRSVKNLRTSLVDAGIALPLLKLLSDESVDVQTTASATLCNIVLDFSPMKKTVLENGGVERLVTLVNSMDSNLRLNAVWALKNMLYQADSEIKQAVMRQLQYATLETLISDSEVSIQEQALNLLRNLVCGREQDIQEVFQGIGAQKLMNVFAEKLGMMGQDEIILQTLYVIVNISTGNEMHKAAIMNHERILPVILHHMGHEKPTIRVATVWCAINLTWPEDPNSEDRVARLKQMGFEEKLGNMVDDPDLDVKDRTKTAIQHFEAVSLGGGGSQASANAMAMDTVGAMGAFDPQQRV